MNAIARLVETIIDSMDDNPGQWKFGPNHVVNNSADVEYCMDYIITGDHVIHPTWLQCRRIRRAIKRLRHHHETVAAADAIVRLIEADGAKP